MTGRSFVPLSLFAFPASSRKTISEASGDDRESRGKTIVLNKMAEPPLKKSRVRQPVLTQSERKRRKQERDRTKSKTRIYIGDEHERWIRVRNERGLKTDFEIAKYLLDM